MISRALNGVTNPLQVQYWRDSADFIVTSTPQVLFSSSTFDQVIYTENSDYLHIDYSEGSVLVPVSVPAGNYDSYLVKGSVTSLGGLPAIPEWKSPRTYWAADVGRVRWYNYFVFGSYGLRYDLLRYHV